MTNEELVAAEAPNLPPDSSECWSSEGALWNHLGRASGLSIPQVLRAERLARESFDSRDAAISKVKAALR